MNINMYDIYLHNKSCYVKLNTSLYGGTNTKVKEYMTHDNCGRPFLVKINGHKVDVYTYENSYDKHDKLLHQFTAKKIFIGRNPSTSNTINTNQFIKEDDGNSILLYINHHKKHNKDCYEYIFIGDKIFSFDTDTKINKYVSPIGNSDVIWPFAVDQKNRYYLLCLDDGGYIMEMDPNKRNKEGKIFMDPYDYYYEVHAKCTQNTCYSDGKATYCKDNAICDLSPIQNRQILTPRKSDEPSPEDK